MVSFHHCPSLKNCVMVRSVTSWHTYSEPSIELDIQPGTETVVMDFAAWI